VSVIASSGMRRLGVGKSLVAVDLADLVQMLLELSPTPSPPVWEERETKCTPNEGDLD
jgi:hypothetical protein